VPTYLPGLNFPGAHCYNTCKSTAAVAAVPLVVKLLLLGVGIVGKVLKRKRTDPDRQTDFGNTRLMECRRPAFCVCARAQGGVMQAKLGVAFLKGDNFHLRMY